MKKQLLLVLSLFVLVFTGCGDSKNKDDVSAGVGDGGPLNISVSNVVKLDYYAVGVAAITDRGGVIADGSIEGSGFEITLPTVISRDNLSSISDESVLFDPSLGIHVISNKVTFSDPNAYGCTVSFVAVNSYDEKYGQVVMAKGTENGIGSSECKYVYVDRPVKVLGNMKVEANVDGYDVMINFAINASLEAGWNRLYYTATKFSESSMTMNFKISGSRVAGLRWIFSYNNEIF